MLIEGFGSNLWIGRHPLDWGVQEEGQSLVIVSLSMVVLIAMLGVVIDIGHGQVVERQMQVAADAASLAGARELAMGNDEATAAARMEQMLTANEADLARSTIRIENGNQTVVTARQNVPTFFTATFGIYTIPAAASSRAAYGQLGQADNLMPLAVEEDLWILGQDIVLWGEKNGPGNFGWVRWSGQVPSTTTLRANIDDPARSDTLAIGDRVRGHTGVSFNAVVNNLNAWIGKEVTVFFFQPQETTGTGANLTYRVRGFARFRMAGTYAQGQHSEIYGEFLEYVELGGRLGPSQAVGSMAVTLVQ